MPWYPDHYEHDDDPSEQYNSWDDMQDDYFYEEELTIPGYSSDNPLAGYGPDRMWGGSDQISITAMWMGDPAAEIYCWNKANRLGGYPWDDGVPVHSSYYGSPRKPVDKDALIGVAFACGVFIVAILISALLGLS